MASETRDFVQKHSSVHFAPIEVGRGSSTNPPENFMFDTLKMRPRSMSHHLSSTKVPSRKWLKIQANFWRSLMAIGMRLHDYAPPKPPQASFIRKIPTDTIPVELYFYTPPDYHRLVASGHRFPIVVNFHGGGFCLGHATDDRYWFRVVMERTDAVVVSVNYRLAPEHPFPIPVDDAVDSMAYLSKHAEELGLDTTRVALSGFSAGANLAFAVPLRIKYHTLEAVRSGSTAEGYDSDHSEDRNINTSSASLHSIAPNLSNSTTNLLQPSPAHLEPTPLKIVSIIAWYPLLDWTASRAAKKRGSRNPKKTLPKTFTDLFDYSYLPPPDTEGIHCSPYASPGLAPDHMLRDGLPADIQMWLCEWDMLLQEGEKFATRLEGLHKHLDTRLIPNVPHGFDKSPNPFRKQKNIDGLYISAAAKLKGAFDA